MPRRALLAIIATVVAAAAALAPASGDTAWVPPRLSAAERGEWQDGRPPGWSEAARRVGRDCPPGLAKQGRCGPGAAPTGAFENDLREALERLRRWARDTIRLPGPLMDSMLAGVEGAARHGVPLDVAERVGKAAAERRLTPLGIEQITRALAYGARHGVAPADMEAFAGNGLAAGVPPESIALGIYRHGPAR